MPNAPRVSATPVEELPADPSRLVSAIHALPDQYSRDLIPSSNAWSRPNAAAAFSRSSKTPEPTALDMKYLMFDVKPHATNATNTTLASKNRASRTARPTIRTD
jgi:hypothetical protein